MAGEHIFRVILDYPHKYLWPNGRSRVRAANHREEQKHKQWAYIAALEALQRDGTGGLGQAPIPVTIRVHGKPTGPMPDKDNVIAAAKHSLDGIALALQINDRDFAAPLVEFAPERTSRFVIEVGA